MKSKGKQRKRCIVIEDDATMGHMLRAILRDAGFQTSLAPTGPMGLDLIRQGNVDFIVLDVNIPEMDGFEVYQVMQDDPALRKIPVLVITAWDDDPRMVRVEQLGIRHFLSKPFTEGEFLERVGDILQIPSLYSFSGKDFDL